MRKLFIVLALLFVAGCQNKPAEVNNPDSTDAVKQEVPKAEEAKKEETPKADEAKKEEAPVKQEAPKAEEVK